MSRPCPPDPVQAGPGPARTGPIDPQLVHEVGEHRSISALARRDQQHQGLAFAVDQSVDFGAQSAAGTANGMVVRFSKQISCNSSRPPLWRGEGLCRAGGRG